MNEQLIVYSLVIRRSKGIKTKVKSNVFAVYVMKA